MPDSPLRLLLQEVVQTVLFGVAVICHGLLINIVQQVEVKVLDTAALQLFFKYLGRLQFLHAMDILMPGELVRQMPGLPGVSGKGSADGAFGLSVVVGMGGVKVVDPGRHRRVHHPVQLGLINGTGSVREQGQAHRAEAECRELKILKLFVQHVFITPDLCFLGHLRFPHPEGWGLLFCPLSHADLSGIQAAQFPALGPHHQGKVPVEVQRHGGFRLLPRGKDVDFLAEDQRASAVLVKPGLVREASVVVHQPVQHAGRQAAAQLRDRLFSERGARDASQLFREVRRRNPGVDPDSDDQVVYLSALTVQRGLRQNSADLSSVHIDVVDPLDLGVHRGEALNGLRHRHGGAGRDACGVHRLQGRAQQDTQIDPAVRRRIEASPAPAAAGRLLSGDQAAPLRGALLGHRLQHRIGGRDRAIYPQVQAFRREIFSDVFLPKHVAPG